MDFTIDTIAASSEKEENEDNKIISQVLKEYKESLVENSTSTDIQKKKHSEVRNFLAEVGWTKSKNKKNQDSFLDSRIPSSDIKEILKKSVITPEFEKSHTVPPAEISDKKLRELRKKQAESTKGKKWFGLPATEMTEEIKNDLEILQMRSALDPKRFYKKNDLKVLPKYFQIGKVLDSPLDYNNRLTNKERKRTLVDELLADAEFNKYNKRKYKEIIEEKQKTHYKQWRKMKRLKKKK